MKILVTGANGQLGKALQEVLKNEEALFTDVEEMDITEPVMIEATFKKFKPDWLVHGAAMTNVDGCEENPEIAEKINAGGTKNLVEACKKYHCRMIYISTDYVFDGKKKEPYTEDDTPNPQSVYGKTKLAGEKATLEMKDSYVIRTSWVYGDGKNFIRTMLALSEKRNEIKVVNDQVGRPTYAPDLAEAIYGLIKKQPEPGIYNITGDGETVSWANFARKILDLTNKKTRVVGISTEEYFAQSTGNIIAPRPEYSVLSLNKANKKGIRTIESLESLEKYISNIA